MLLYLKNEQKISDYQYNLFIDKINNGDFDMIEETRSTSSNDKLFNIYNDIYQQSFIFWNNKYQSTRASRNFAYGAFYDAVGGAIGACFGSEVPGIGNYLLGTCMSTLFSYAADCRRPRHISGAGGSW